MVTPPPGPSSRPPPGIPMRPAQPASLVTREHAGGRARRDEAAVEPVTPMHASTKTPRSRARRASPAKVLPESPSPVVTAPTGSGANGTLKGPVDSAPAPRSSQRRAPRKKKLADLPPAGFPMGTPTRSNGAVNSGVDRATVSSLAGLEPMLGPKAPSARVAIEACREAWFVHAKLTEWGNEVLLTLNPELRRSHPRQHAGFMSANSRPSPARSCFHPATPQVAVSQTEARRCTQ